LTALGWYRSSWMCVAPKFCSASQAQSRRYRHLCRWALIWDVSATHSRSAICSKAHSAGVAEQSSPRSPVPDGPNALPRPRYTLPPAAHSARLLTYHLRALRRQLHISGPCMQRTRFCTPTWRDAVVTTGMADRDDSWHGRGMT
jgi:hypothetical protein